MAIEPSRGASFEAIKRARAASCPVILDIDYRPYSWKSRDEAAKICGGAARQADILIGNDEEFAVLAGQDDGLSFARAFADEHSSILVYKRGEKGLIAFVDGETIEMGIYPVKALKPTGAGDAFMGGFVSGLAQGLKPKDSLQRGAASAALVVTRVGCSTANPNEEDLQNFMKSHHINR